MNGLTSGYDGMVTDVRWERSTRLSCRRSRTTGARTSVVAGRTQFVIVSRLTTVSSESQRHGQTTMEGTPAAVIAGHCTRTPEICFPTDVFFVVRNASAAVHRRSSTSLCLLRWSTRVDSLKEKRVRNWPAGIRPIIRCNMWVNKLHHFIL